EAHSASRRRDAPHGRWCQTAFAVDNDNGRLFGQSAKTIGNGSARPLVQFSTCFASAGEKSREWRTSFCERPSFSLFIIRRGSRSLSRANEGDAHGPTDNAHEPARRLRNARAAITACGGIGARAGAFEAGSLSLHSEG